MANLGGTALIGNKIGLAWRLSGRGGPAARMAQTYQLKKQDYYLRVNWQQAKNSPLSYILQAWAHSNSANPINRLFCNKPLSTSIWAALATQNAPRSAYGKDTTHAKKTARRKVKHRTVRWNLLTLPYFRFNHDFATRSSDEHSVHFKDYGTAACTR